MCHASTDYGWEVGVVLLNGYTTMLCRRKIRYSTSFVKILILQVSVHIDTPDGMTSAFSGRLVETTGEATGSDRSRQM